MERAIEKLPQQIVEALVKHETCHSWASRPSIAELGRSVCGGPESESIQARATCSSPSNVVATVRWWLLDHQG